MIWTTCAARNFQHNQDGEEEITKWARAEHGHSECTPCKTVVYLSITALNCNKETHFTRECRRHRRDLSKIDMDLRGFHVPVVIPRLPETGRARAANQLQAKAERAHLRLAEHAALAHT